MSGCRSWRGFFDLDTRRTRIATLEKETTADGFWDDNRKAQDVLKEITVHKKKLELHARLDKELSDLIELYELVDRESTEAVELAEASAKLEAELDKVEFQTQLSGPDDHRDALVSIHAGAGGTESQDWAEMLFRMYNRWAELRGFAIDLIDYQPGDEAGMKSATMEIKGEYAFGYLKSESGVHRLVRISPFDANARRHTSFVSVHSYPVVEDMPEIEIKDDEIRIDTYRASGAGGQHVNRTESAIRITHIPSGIVVTCQTERSQHKNKDSAFRVLRARLYVLKREMDAKRLEKFDKTKLKIEWGSQIRSYVFHPYNMVKDHRTDFETSNVQAVMDGNIDGFIQAYLSDPELREQVV